MSQKVQFTLYSHKSGPNGWKVVFLLEELRLSYDIVWLDFAKDEQKLPPHVDLNPNGRIPTLVDHQRDEFVLWESNAILLYLSENYDKDGKFMLSDPNDKHRQLQWLLFQASGQGPYFGQAFHFLFSHPAVVPSAVKRYQDEVKRVVSVLESVLSKQDWLAMFPWHDIAIHLFFAEGRYDAAEEAPHVHAWSLKLKERPSIKKAWAERERRIDSAGLSDMVSRGHQKIAEAAKE